MHTSDAHAGAGTHAVRGLESFPAPLLTQTKLLRVLLWMWLVGHMHSHCHSRWAAAATCNSISSTEEKLLGLGFFMFLRWTYTVLPHISVFFLLTPAQTQSPSYGERQMSNSSAVTGVVLLQRNKEFAEEKRWVQYKIQLRLFDFCCMHPLKWWWWMGQRSFQNIVNLFLPGRKLEKKKKKPENVIIWRLNTR